jgi:hypothetical protein
MKKIPAVARAVGAVAVAVAFQVAGVAAATMPIVARAVGAAVAVALRTRCLVALAKPQLHCKIGRHPSCIAHTAK